MKYYLKKRSEKTYDLVIDNDTSFKGEPLEWTELTITAHSESGLHILRSLVNTLNNLAGVEEKEKFYRPKPRNK